MAHESNRRPELLMTGPYQPWDDAWLSTGYDVHRLWEAADRAACLAEHGAGVRAIATRGDLGADAALIAALPKLEIIACYGVGTDAIDLGVGLTLALLRRIGAGDAYVRSGAWSDGDMPLVTRLYGKRVGIVGFGRIGSTLARRLSGFDVELGYFDVAPRDNSQHRFFGRLAELAGWCDVLIVTLAGGASTRHLVDAAVLDALGPRGYLVNVSRGTTVDEPALLDALERGAIAGAALDVFWNEPRIDPRFLALPNVLLQPHHASGTVETRQAMGWLVRDNLAAHFAGAPLLTPVV
ncbi:2-hydroxyacid dehydrogenase [Burkholderia sp. SCN-KJ]|uniref:2-hydroxyacid dehydrogenase n=1 Tax=Burkholderia sp. SCN-KJ TaxID=2969248 RepID=UPI00214FDD03|nr:2-hydroxyacid dehydrogenase [Burkholderia sp. SCN-KJ]MCR4465203.1 2-hydroxyacid dehydrogenase [Burkholderia sp. SCN-KJ]